MPWYVYANKATNGDIAWNKLLWQGTQIVHICWYMIKLNPLISTFYYFVTDKVM